MKNAPPSWPALTLRMNAIKLIDTEDTPAGFLKDLPEGEDFYRACQHAIPEFTMNYLVASRTGKRIAVIPYFVTNFRLNTMLGNSWSMRMFGWAKLGIACIGHPTVGLGRIDGEVSGELLDAAYQLLSRKAAIVACKGFAKDLPATGFVRAAGLPVAMLHLDGDFWDNLHGHKTRNDLKRKLKASSALRFEQHDGLPENHLSRVHELYLNTRNRSPIQFEYLSPEYFSNTSRLSIYVLAFLDDRLVGFAQMLSKGDKAVGKYLGMDYAVNRGHDLYFALYLQALEICSQQGFREIEFGESSYRFKKELGCKLVDTWVYYRHRNPVAHALLSRFAFLLEPSSDELR